MRLRKLLVSAVATLLAAAAVPLISVSPASAAGLPNGFTDTPVLTGMFLPETLAIAPDGRVFVGEKPGTIETYTNLNTDGATLAADIRTEVYNLGDRGLSGVAVDPQWPTRPYVYVNYAYDAPLGGTAPVWNDQCPDPPGLNTQGCVISGRVSRLTMNPVTGVWTGVEKVLVSGWCQQYSSHSNDGIRFGPEGALYITAGEGASFTFADWGQNGYPQPNPCGDYPGGVGTALSFPTTEGGSLRAQSLSDRAHPTVLSGSMIRIDPDTGEGWPTNPLHDDPDPNARRIVAMGLRNPFRFNFDPRTNNVIIGDVGWNTIEETDLLPSTFTTVKNFGWPCREANNQVTPFKDSTLCQNLEAANAFTPPFWNYVHKQPVNATDTCSTSGGSSVTGTAIYPDSGPFPAQYKGALFEADYSRACIWVMQRDAAGNFDPSTVKTFTAAAGGIVDLTVGPDGNLYYVSIGGQVHRIAYNGSTPTATIDASSLTGPDPLTVNFSAARSTDPNGDILTYSWDLNGDGVLGDSTSAAPSFTYTTKGTFTVTLQVTNTTGQTGTTTVLVTSGDTLPDIHITSPSSTLTWVPGDTVNFTGTATDAEDGVLPASAYHWEVVLHHCTGSGGGCHIHFLSNVDGATGGSFVAPDHDYPSYATITLTVTDSQGGTSVASVDLQPKTTTLSLRSNPPEQPVQFSDVATTSPYDTTVILGSLHDIGAPASVPVGDGTLTFGSWSNGGPMVQTLTVSGPTTLTANYVNNNVPTITVNDATVSETASPPSVPVVFKLSKPSTVPVTFTVTEVPGTATAADFYQAAAPFPLTFNPGQTTLTTFIGIKDDALYETNEQFNVNISAAQNAVIARPSATVTIVENDLQPTIVVHDNSTLKPQTPGGYAVPITVSLTRKSAFPTVVRLWTADGSAHPDMYFPKAPTLVTIPALANGATVYVGIRPSTTYTGDTYFFLTAEPYSGAIGAPSTGKVTIYETITQPATPAAQISIRDAGVMTNSSASGLTVTLPVVLSQAAAVPVTASWTTVNGTAVAGTDYTASSGTVTFAAGETTQSITVPILPIGQYGTSRAFTVTLSAPVGATVARATGKVTVTANNALPTLAIGNASVTTTAGASGLTASVPVTLSGTPTVLTTTVAYSTTDGTGVAGTDYTATTGTLSIAPGQTSGTITVPILANATYGSVKTFTVTLANPTYSVVTGTGVGTVTVTANNTIPVVSTADATVITNGTASGLTVPVPVTLTNPSTTPVTVAYATTDGSAVAGTDYTATSGTLTFNPGETTKSVLVPVAANPNFNVSKTFSLAISAPSGATLGTATATVTITTTLPTVSIGNASVVTWSTASGLTVAVPVTLSGSSRLPVTVNYATADGTALAGTDYTASSGTLTFNVGETGKFVVVPIAASPGIGTSKTFSVTLSAPVSATLGTATGTVTIATSNAPLPVITIADASVVEGNPGDVPGHSAAVKLTLDKPSTSSITVSYQTSPGTASALDYWGGTGTVTFLPGQVTKFVFVGTRPDLTYEGNEQFSVTLSSPVNATIGRGTAAVTITDDDPMPTLSVADVTYHYVTPPASISIPITLTGPTALTTTVLVTIVPGTAGTNAIYTTPRTVTFLPGQTKVITFVGVKAHTVKVPSEAFTVTLSSPTNATISRATATITILPV